jgi:hypothetical protein
LEFLGGAAVVWPRAIRGTGGRVYLSTRHDEGSLKIAASFILTFFRRSFACSISSLTEGVILQEGPRMKKTFLAFAIATIAGSLAAPPVSAQRGTAAGVAAPGRYYEPAPYGAGRGPYDYFGSCEWVTQRFYDGYGWRVRRVRVCG